MNPIPSLMKGVQLIGHGGPEKLVFSDDIQTPSLTPKDVLIKVLAAGVNNTLIPESLGTQKAMRVPQTPVGLVMHYRFPLFKVPMFAV